MGEVRRGKLLAALDGVLQQDENCVLGADHKVSDAEFGDDHTDSPETN